MIKMIQKAIDYNCEKLGISAPEVELCPASTFATATTMAALSFDGKKLAVNETLNRTTLDVWFMASHEMRHKWQLDNGWQIGEYQSSDVLNVCRYNQQDLEVDAHAWSCLVLADMFGVRPQLESILGKDVWELIEIRMNQIKLLNTL